MNRHDVTDREWKSIRVFYLWNALGKRVGPGSIIGP